MSTWLAKSSDRVESMQKSDKTTAVEWNRIEWGCHNSRNRDIIANHSKLDTE